MIHLVVIFFGLIGSFAHAERYRLYSQEQGRSSYDRTDRLRSTTADNQWELKHRYYIDQYGRVIAHGQSGDAGRAMRTYNHGGNPERIQRMLEREEHLQKVHRNYVDSTRQYYDRQAQYRMESLRTGDRFYDKMQTLSSGIHDIHKKLHDSDMEKNW